MASIGSASILSRPQIANPATVNQAIIIYNIRRFGSYYPHTKNKKNRSQTNENLPSAVTRTVTPIEGKNRILIVDDEQDIAKLFKVALERAGFVADVFNDPLESLSSYRIGVYDLLLLDIKMPQMSGFELYNNIKQIDDKVKVCFMTAFEEYYDEFKKQFPHLKETECFIRKPVGVEDLIRKVKSQMNYN